MKQDGIILNCDCMQYMKNMSNNSVQMILTDIPYNEAHKKSNGLRDLDKKEEDQLNFDLQEFVKECCRVCKGAIYIFCGGKQLSYIIEYLEDENFGIIRFCACCKKNPSPLNGQHFWLSAMELCVAAKRRRTKFNYSCKKNWWPFAVERGKLIKTQKRLELIEHILLASSDPGDIVFDPCAGSMTTGHACLKNNRKFICTEIDKERFKKGKKRLNAFNPDANIEHQELNKSP